MFGLIGFKGKFPWRHRREFSNTESVVERPLSPWRSRNICEMVRVSIWLSYNNGWICSPTATQCAEVRDHNITDSISCLIVYTHRPWAYGCWRWFWPAILLHSSNVSSSQRPQRCFCWLGLCLQWRSFIFMQEPSSDAASFPRVSTLHRQNGTWLIRWWLRSIFVIDRWRGQPYFDSVLVLISAIDLDQWVPVIANHWPILQLALELVGPAIIDSVLCTRRCIVSGLHGTLPPQSVNRLLQLAEMHTAWSYSTIQWQRVFRTTLQVLQINYLTPSWHIELAVGQISLRLSVPPKLSWNVTSALKGERFRFILLTTPHSYTFNRSPVIIFLSDGECDVSDQTVQDLCRSAVNLGFVSQILFRRRCPY